MNGAQKALQALELTVGYDGREVVSDIDFSIEAGETLVLIGPNGSGKSTVLKSISKHLEPLGGTVFIGKDDLAATSVSALARLMAVVLTERPRTELLTCQDIVEAGRYPYTGRLGVLNPHDRERTRWAMELCNVSDLSARDFMHISDGQRQRVLLARAICQEPRVLALDEPTSFLDIRYQVELLRILQRLAHEEGVAVIMSLHEIDLARNIADKVLCVKDGKVFAAGTPDEVFSGDTIARLYDLDDGLVSEAKRFGIGAGYLQ